MVKKKRITVDVFRTPDDMNQAALRLLIKLSRKTVQEQGRFTICLPGGNTPKGLFMLLTMNPFRYQFPWKNTFVFFGDERCVPMNDERNNGFMAMQFLIGKVDVPISQVFRIPVNLKPADAAVRYQDTLSKFFDGKEPAFDLIILGMGRDGHTASLFPGSPATEENEKWVAVSEGKSPEVDRITLTFPVINKARNILMLVTGEEKSAVMKQALMDEPEGSALPVQKIQQTSGEIFWYADSRAASQMPETRVRMR